MEQRWRETCFDNLRVSPETQPVLLTETLKFTKEDREAATKIFFEKFETPAFYLANSAVLSLYATGRVGGVAVIVDEKSTSVVPVYESYAVKKAASNNVSNDEIPEAICNAIMRCDIDTRLEMYRNIVVVSASDADCIDRTTLTPRTVGPKCRLIQHRRHHQERSSQVCRARAGIQCDCSRQCPASLMDRWICSGNAEQL